MRATLNLRICLLFTIALSVLSGCNAVNGVKHNQTNIYSGRPALGKHAMPVAAYVSEDGGTHYGMKKLPPYLIQISDVLDIKFFYNPELNQEVIVRPDGKISLQLIPEIVAAGISPSELKRQLVKAYTDIILQPEIAVIALKISPPKIFVGGEVESPGEMEITPGVTALQAILKRGGFTPDALQNGVVILRYKPNKSPQFIKIDLKTLLQKDRDKYASVDRAECSASPIKKTGGFGAAQCLSTSINKTMRHDLYLEPFDIVYVPQTTIASLAQFFDRYFNNILPIYRNFGFSFVYEVKTDR